MLNTLKKMLETAKQKKAIKKADKDYYFNKAFDEKLAQQEKDNKGGKNG